MGCHYRLPVLRKTLPSPAYLCHKKPSAKTIKAGIAVAPSCKEKLADIAAGFPSGAFGKLSSIHPGGAAAGTIWF